MAMRVREKCVHIVVPFVHLQREKPPINGGLLWTLGYRWTANSLAVWVYEARE
jgi:hypothetical protein